MILTFASVPPELEEFRTEFIAHPGRVIPLHLSLGGVSLTDSAEDLETLQRIRAVCARTKPFEIKLACPCAYLSSKVLWLLPDPMGPVEAMYDRFREAAGWPAHPWGYPSFHATIALTRTLDDLWDAEIEFRQRFPDLLPWAVTVSGIELWSEHDGEFHRHSQHAFTG